jgi:diguanylate cyclase (GGDEF)-like protein
MTPRPPDPLAADSPDAHAEVRLQSLGVEVEAVKALLVRLLQDVVEAERRLERGATGQLVEANEQLVLAALRSQSEVDFVKRALADARQEALVDPLTGLFTRRALIERFSQVVAAGTRDERRSALLFIDLDGFKPLNDQNGHAFGDRVLRLVAERLMAAVRATDTVVRHGGDEFLVLLADLATASEADAMAERILQAIAAPVELDGHAVMLTASAGIALYPDDGESLDILIGIADAAMYASKANHSRSVSVRYRVLPVAVAVTAGSPVAEVEARLVALREANESLVLAVLSAQALQAVAEQARQRQADFMDAVVTELRNPEAPVRIASAMLGQAPGQEPLLSRVQRVVEQRMTRMARLIGDLVEAARDEHGALVLARHRIDLVTIIERAIAMQRMVFDLRGMSIEWQRPEQPVELDGDAARLEQVVANLLYNACAHTPDGGHVILSLAAGEDAVTLSVADDGIGIPPAQLTQVFEPFVQAVGARDIDVPSFGLTAVRTLVQAHGGEVSAHSEGLHRGSRIVVRLPRLPVSR